MAGEQSAGDLPRCRQLLFDQLFVSGKQRQAEAGRQRQAGGEAGTKKRSNARGCKNEHPDGAVTRGDWFKKLLATLQPLAFDSFFVPANRCQKQQEVSTQRGRY